MLFRSEAINQSIQNYAPDNSRSQIIRKGTNTIILDAYNANPTSMEAALKNFSEMAGKKKIVFLGQMAELGEESELEHKRIVTQLAGYRFDTVILVGKNFSGLAGEIAATCFENSSEAAGWAKDQSFSEATILIKGSRSSRMELVLDGL